MAKPRKRKSKTLRKGPLETAKRTNVSFEPAVPNRLSIVLKSESQKKFVLGTVIFEKSNAIKGSSKGIKLSEVKPFEKYMEKGPAHDPWRKLKPEYRGLRLLEKLKTLFRARGFHYVIAKPALHAKGAYRKAGFRPMEERQDLWIAWLI